MWGYKNKISSLEEKALAQVAINLCQENGFKEVAMRLEKPTYGGFISHNKSTFFVSDPEKLSIWARVKEDDRLCKAFMISCYVDEREKVRRWDTAVDEQCRRLAEGIPDLLRQKIYPSMNRVALEYLSYSRRQEVLFGVSRYFLMNIFTRGDWKEADRLDEKKLAQRLLKDERLSVLQRYRIACVYCLHVHFPQLWERLTQEEKRLTSGYSTQDLSKETHSLVLLWSYYMNENQEEKVAWPLTGYEPWTLVYQSMSYGNRAALVVCWDENAENIHQKIIYWALESLKEWQMTEEFHVKETLVSYQSPEDQCARSMKLFNLPSYYSKSMFFFLSQTDEEQQLTFFKKAFQSKYCVQREYGKSVLDCFLEWPNQDAFLPTINRLWGIIPTHKYGQFLLALASKYSGNDKTANRDCDYRSLLRALWEETPKEYKQYLFCDGRSVYFEKVGTELLSRLLERSPFQEKDEALFKRIFYDQPQEERRAMMLSERGKNYSKAGEYMCSLLMQKEKWSFLNGLLEECLLIDEIPDFKKQFICSYCCVKMCLDALEENREKLVEDILDWSLESDAEKMQHKVRIIVNDDYLFVSVGQSHVCESLLRKGKFPDVERLINFCLSSDEKKEQLKVHFAQNACDYLLHDYTYDSWSEDCVWEQMDIIIIWSVGTEEKIRDFKKDLFSHGGIDIHHDLVFPAIREVVWGKVERFYQWFDLSPKEIKQLKRETLFSDRVIKNIYEDLPEYSNKLVDSLHWCLTDKEMVINLKKKVEEYCTDVLDEKKEMKKKQLDHLVSELLDGFRKEEAQDKTDRKGIFVKDTGENRFSVGIEDESSSPRK